MPRVFSICAISSICTPKAASADAIAFVQSLEAAVIAEKATREKQLAEARERTERAEGRREWDRVKAAAGESEDRARPPGSRPEYNESA